MTMLVKFFAPAILAFSICRRHIGRFFARVFMLLFAMLLPMILVLPVAALDSDSEQEATLVADDVEIDFSTGLRIYRGNVVFTQGTIRITCEEMTSHHNVDSDEMDKGVCVGNPGHFQQRPEGEDSDFIGTAMTIIMSQVDDIVTFKNRAKVIQGDTTATGRTIIYNLTTEKAFIKGGEAKSSGDTAGQPRLPSGNSPHRQQYEEAGEEDENTRPKLIIQPKKKKAVEEDGDKDDLEGDLEGGELEGGELEGGELEGGDLEGELEGGDLEGGDLEVDVEGELEVDVAGENSESLRADE